MMNRCTHLPPDSSHSAADDVYMEQPQDHGGKASTELLLHQQQEETGQGSGKAPTPSEQHVVREPEAGDSAHLEDVEMLPTAYRVHRNGKEVACEDCGKQLLQKNFEVSPDKCSPRDTKVTQVWRRWGVCGLQAGHLHGSKVCPR